LVKTCQNPVSPFKVQKTERKVCIREDGLPPFDLPMATTPLTEFGSVWDDDLLLASRDGDEQPCVLTPS